LAGILTKSAQKPFKALILVKNACFYQHYPVRSLHGFFENLKMLKNQREAAFFT
jgi:hypothetical protein